MSEHQISGMARLHALIFSLLFPGLLATFLITQLTRDVKIAGFEPWSWLLCVYFAVQFVEGHESKANYSISRAGINLAELAIMTVIFAALGLFPDVDLPARWTSPAAVAAMIAVVFALPAVHRLIFAPKSLCSKAPGYKFARTLTFMSLVAALLAAFSPRSTWAWATVLILLIAYMILFQFANDRITDRLAPGGKGWFAEFRRPSATRIDATHG